MALELLSIDLQQVLHSLRNTVVWPQECNTSVASRTTLVWRNWGHTFCCIRRPHHFSQSGQIPYHEADCYGGYRLTRCRTRSVYLLFDTYICCSIHISVVRYIYLCLIHISVVRYIYLLFDTYICCSIHTVYLLFDTYICCSIHVSVVR